MNAPWNDNAMNAHWTKFDDTDEHRPYWYDFTQSKSTYTRPNDYESNEEISSDSAAD